jgi:hypothetical protein
MLLAPTLAALTITISDYSGAQLRSQTNGSDTALDVYTSPAASAVFGFKRSSLAFSYSVSFGLIDATREPTYVVMQQGGVVHSWWTRRLRLSTSVSGALGSQSYLGTPSQQLSVSEPDSGSGQNAAPEQQPAGDAASTFLPQREVVETFAARLSLGLSYSLSRRWSYSQNLGYDVSGGRGVSEDFLPLQRGPSAALSLSHQLTRRDTLVTTLDGRIIDVPSRDSRFVTIGAQETWQHRFAERTTGQLGAGLSYLRARPAADAPIDHSLYGVGSAAFGQGYALADRALLSLTLSSSLSTSYNPLTATVAQRLSGSAGVSWEKERLTLSASTYVTQTLPPNAPDAARSYGAGATAQYRLVDRVLLVFGARWSHQVVPETVLSEGDFSPDQWAIFAGIGLGLPPLVL